MLKGKKMPPAATDGGKAETFFQCIRKAVTAE